MGFVYLATNKELQQGLVKIGSSKDADERVKSLVSSGVPGRYEAKCSCYVQDEVGVEKRIHTMLKHVHHDKEFYKVDWLVAAGILMTLALEEKGVGVKPELAKWLRQELLEVSGAPGAQLKKDENVASLPNSANERRIAYMEYIRKNVNAKDSSQRAKRCDEYLRHLAEEVLKISTVYGITSIQEAERIYFRLSSKGDLTKANKQYMQGGMSAAMGHYLKFLRNLTHGSSQPINPPSASRKQASLSSDVESMCDNFMEYLRTKCGLKRNTVTAYKNALIFTGSQLISKNIFEITDITKLGNILRKFEKDEIKTKKYGGGAGICKALERYIEFLKRGGR